MDTKLSGKRALVLGASRGLGLAIAQAFAAEGARVALTARDGNKAASVAAGMGAAGFACDTGSAEQVDALFADVTAALGGVDILVLNGGGPPASGAQGVSSDQWRRSFDSMFVNLVRLADLALPAMKERRFGRVISVVSSGVVQPIPNLAISNAIRPALIGWGKTLATELAPHGITVNAVAPGRIATDRIRELDEANAKRSGRSMDEIREASLRAIPAGRMGDPAEYAAAFTFLASEAASYITGSVLRVDGGLISST